jgi:phospholipid/cholesterol/gamma-HCH transport system ATP-binding protein
MTSILQAHDISKAFGPKILFRHASLDVHEGETLAIIGESGSGKSVLLKMFIGLADPDDGELRFKGDRIADMDQEGLNAIRQQVGYVFQNDALFDSMTILENVGYGLREHSSRSDAEIRDRAVECLTMVGLDQRILEQHPASLSGGMRKRVGIARAIANKPELLLYDEPTQGLDPQNITRIAEMIVGMQRDLRATSVVVTHDMRTAFSAADRIALLHEHRFEFVGTPQELARSREEPVREFIAEALEELKDVPGLWG